MVCNTSGFCYTVRVVVLKLTVPMLRLPSSGLICLSVAAVVVRPTVEICVAHIGLSCALCGVVLLGMGLG